MFAQATAQNLVYRLFDITPEEFRREVLRLLTGGVRGLNITLPHKQAAAELVNELTPRAARAQAVNVIAHFDDATLLGDNTESRARARTQAHSGTGSGRRGARRARAAVGARSSSADHRQPYARARSRPGT
jgi:shikimate dehydrogenase